LITKFNLRRIKYDPEREKRLDEYKRQAEIETSSEALKNMFRASFKVTGVESCFRKDDGNVLYAKQAYDMGYIKHASFLPLLDKNFGAGSGYWIHGPSRIGKSTLMRSKLFEYANTHKLESINSMFGICKMVRWDPLYKEFIKRYQDNKEDDLNISRGIQQMKDCKILVIDEIPENISEAAQSFMFDVLEKRCFQEYREGGSKETYFTSNYSLDHFCSGIKNVGLIGRIKEICTFKNSVQNIKVGEIEKIEVDVNFGIPRNV